MICFNFREVVFDDELKIHYDVMLSKIDVGKGHWGLYNFYKMQVRLAAKSCDDNVMIGKSFPNYWPFVRGIHLDSPHKGPVMRSFDVFFVVCLYKLLNKQSNYGWFVVPWYSCDIIVILIFSAAVVFLPLSNKSRLN